MAGFSNRDGKVRNCTPTIPDPRMYWRENSIRKAAKQANLRYIVAGATDNSFMPPPLHSLNGTKELIVLPYLNYTSVHHELHASGQDCTHYCASPFLYQPLWRSLRLAMDRQYMTINKDKEDTSEKG